MEMSAKERPLILITNDDGIDSEALWAAVEAVLPLGEVLVVAPDRQWSGAGRSVPFDVTGRLLSTTREIGGERVSAYAVDASPALAVVHGVIELAPRRPSLVISGINFGSNTGRDPATWSGTIGAALEGGAFGIPSMAVSLGMRGGYLGDEAADYTAAKAVTQQFARRLLAETLPHDVDALNISIPAGATPSTPWRITRLCNCARSWKLPNRADGQGRPGIGSIEDRSRIEPDSDVWALSEDHVVAVTPLSLDLTSRVDFATLERILS
jgi:5'-nucleotidase